MRSEKDFLGELHIDENRYYGISTVRAYHNFGDTGERHDKVFLKAYLNVKKAAALSNMALQYLEKEKAQFIIRAIDKIFEDNLFDDFIVNPLCGGAGTSLNMNVNEVIANYALEIAGKRKGDYGYICPRSHVNMHQSTNDTYPTAFKIAVLMHLDILEKRLVELQNELQQKEIAFSSVVKLGRTELQDALPMTVGMQFAAYAEAIARDRWRIFKARERIKMMNIGGTAIGTGFNAPQKYIFLVIEKLREITGLRIARAENLIEATQNLDSIVEVSGLIKTLAVNLMKIAEDLRLLSSGPSGGFGELRLPAVQEGSSIMPGKVNPVIPEFVSQTSFLIIGNDSVIAQAAGHGNLELNQFYPLVSYLMLKNLKLLQIAISRLYRQAIKNLKIDEDKIDANLSDSIALVTYLSQYIGHDKASQVYLKHRASKKSVKEIMLEENILSSEELEEMLASEKIKMVGLKK
jgi:aspartate ammonia-lyase